MANFYNAGTGFIKDGAFKRIFNENREFLVLFISKVLNISYHEVDDNLVILDNKISDNLNVKNKQTDLLYESVGIIINIEANGSMTKVVKDKNTAYICQLYLRQIRIGDYYKIKPIFQININKRSPFSVKRFLDITKLVNVETLEIRSENITIYDINLDYLETMSYEDKLKLPNDDLKKLVIIFSSENKDDFDKLYNGNKIMERVIGTMKDMIKDFDGFLYYDREAFEKAEREEISYNQGEKQGMEIATENIVKNMILNNIPDEKIVSSTNITKEKLKQIKTVLKKKGKLK